MNDVSTTDIARLKRDLALRGYTDADIEELLGMPVLLIPGPITPEDSDTPSQKLTKHIAFLSKDLQQESIPNEVVLRQDVQRTYVEERHAHVELGTIVVSLFAVRQIATFADIAQILDFLLNLLRIRFGAGRTAQLMPNLKFDLELHDGERIAKLQIEGPADQVTKNLTPGRVNAMLANLREDRSDDRLARET
jgi:hypothetical protein